MYIEFKSKSLQKHCENITEGTRQWGKPTARKVVQRINELKRLDSFSDISHLPPMDRHQLKGNRAGQIAISAGKSMRILIEPIDEIREIVGNPSGAFESGVRILAVEDYHE